MEYIQLNWNNGRPWSVGDKIVFQLIGKSGPLKAVVTDIVDITENDCYLETCVVVNKKEYYYIVPASQCKLRLHSALRFEHLAFSITKTLRA